MKTPRYIKMGKPELSPDGKINLPFKIAWWGWLVIIFRAMRTDYRIKWYQWPIAMAILVKAWIKAMYVSRKRGEFVA